MTKTGAIWFYPAAAFAIWAGTWAAWCSALMWWLPQAHAGHGAAGGPNEGPGAEAEAKAQAGNGEDIVNGHQSWTSPAGGTAIEIEALPAMGRAG